MASLEQIKFMQEKTIELIKETNDDILNLELSNSNITLLRLSGLSNMTYFAEYNDTNIKIRKFIFKLFGKISILVDRKQENYAINHFARQGLGPKVYATDHITYRVVEYLENTKLPKKNDLLSSDILNKMFTNLSMCNSMEGNDIYLTNDCKKDYLFQFLKFEDSNSNIIGFIEKMVIPTNKNLDIFIEEAINHKKDESFVTELKEIKEVLKLNESILYELFPEHCLIVMSHNDAHRGNLLEDENQEKLFLIDHEYCGYNSIGFDIANYLTEALFFEYEPEYKCNYNNISEILKDDYFEIYSNYIENFKNSNIHRYTEKIELFTYLIEHANTKECFLKQVALCNYLWAIYSIYYLDYDSLFVNKEFDYLKLYQDRIKIVKDIMNYFEINL